MNKEMVEKIKKFYNPIVTERNEPAFLIDGNLKTIPNYNSNRKIILTFGGEERFETTPKEIIENVFPDWFEKHKFKFVPDSKTQRYFDLIKQTIGLVKVEYGSDWIELENPKSYDIRGLWVIQSEIGMKDGMCVVQYSERTDIDDYVIGKYFFNRYPSKEDFEAAQLLDEIETYLQVHGWDKVKFICWECGQEKHFVDIEGSFEEKVQSWKEKYCGC